VTTPKRPPILIVEDDDNIAQMLRYLLRREGYNPVLIPDGRVAVETVANYKPPALIIMDMKLPYVDGLRLVKIVRATPGWEAVPILMLTSITDETMISRVLEAGATDYVVKPFQMLDLLARVKRYAGRV
jgi:DNA-binding response OmpR family regulator